MKFRLFAAITVMMVFAFDASADPDLVMQLRADSLAGYADGDPVTVWTDSSGYNNDLTSVGIPPPTFEANEDNGGPVLRFSQPVVGSAMGTDSINGLTAGPTTAFTKVMRLRYAAWTNHFRVPWAYTNKTYVHAPYGSLGQTFFSSRGGPRPTFPFQLGVYYDLVWVEDGSSAKLYVNGVQLDYGNSGSALNLTNTKFTLGNHHNRASGNAIVADISAFLLYNRALSTVEIDEVIDNLGDPPNLDTDGDGVNDDDDNCPDDFNPAQDDLDEDGEGDVCDDDADGDGDSAASDCNDLDPSIYTGAEEICNDGIDNDCDALVDLDDTDGDCDGDGIVNFDDNCPDDFNPGQVDTDGDSDGDACDVDDDNDGVNDDVDNCPSVANNDQSDLDGDGAGDVCDDDADGDGVPDFDGDQCHFTATSDADAGVPSRRLGKNRWADVDGDGEFDTTGNNPTGRQFTMTDTGGCNCAQIIELCGYGQGHTKFGCSNSVMDWWTGLHDRDGEAAYQCKDD